MTEENAMNEVCTCTHRQAAHMGTVFHGACINTRCHCIKYTFKNWVNPFGKPVKHPMSRAEFKQIKKEHRQGVRANTLV